MATLIEVLAAGLFHAAALFLVAAGLQLVSGVQRIVNLACGAFYALGAYSGVTLGGYALSVGLPPVLALPVLVLAGAAAAIRSRCRASTWPMASSGSTPCASRCGTGWCWPRRWQWRRASAPSCN